MDRVFVEEEKDGQYRIAVVDRDRIFKSDNPGLLATVFECPLIDPSISDRAQIFYALGREIGAVDWEIDLHDIHRSVKLNHWSIQQRKQSQNTDSLFLAIRPLLDKDRLKLYSTKHSISPTEIIRSESPSLFSILAFSSQQQKWKTGILQRCIDCLVKPEYRGQAEVYTTVDKVYRHLLRFKLETEGSQVSHLCDLIRQIIRSLGLKHSHDTTLFAAISEETFKLMEMAIELIPTFVPQARGPLSSTGRLSLLLNRWSGASLIMHRDQYCIQVDPDVERGLVYMDTFLPEPESLVILDTPM